MRETCTPNFVHNDLAVVVTGRKPGLFVEMTTTKISSLWASQRSSNTMYCFTAINRILADSPYVKWVRLPPISVFVSHTRV